MQTNDLCNIELFEIEQFDHFTGCIYKMYLELMYLIYMYKKDLALNNQHCLICIKNQRKANQILYIHVYQIYMIIKHILLITFLNEPKVIFLHTVKRVLL